MKFAVIADDLTGANDSGVQLTCYGLEAAVLLQPSEGMFENKDVVIVDTDSRSLPMQKAYEKVKRTVQSLKNYPFDVIIKKIDSTLRGNIGSEIDAVYDSLHPDLVIIAPSYPEQGRQVINGYHYVNGTLLHQTEIGKDLKTPVKSAHVPTLLREQTPRKVALITHHDLDRGEVYLISRLKALVSQQIPYVVFDSRDGNDLLRIAAAVRQSNLSVVWVGSAGLGGSIPAVYGLKRKKQNQVLTTKEKQAVLLVVGSVSVVTRQQLDVVLSQKIKGVQLDAKEIVQGSDRRMHELICVKEKITEAIKKGQHIALYSSGAKENIVQARAIGRKRGLSDQAVSDEIAKSLGKVVSSSIAQCGLKRMVLTGGDTAKQVFHHLGATCFELIGEVEAGIPFGRLTGKTDAYVATKAGAFGHDHSLLNAVRLLERLV